MCYGDWWIVIIPQRDCTFTVLYSLEMSMPRLPSMAILIQQLWCTKKKKKKKKTRVIDLKKKRRLNKKLSLLKAFGGKLIMCSRDSNGHLCSTYTVLINLS